MQNLLRSTEILTQEYAKPSWRSTKDSEYLRQRLSNPAGTSKMDMADNPLKAIPHLKRLSRRIW